MDISDAYEGVWGFAAPKKCREMHAARLFEGRNPDALQLALFEVYEAPTIAKGDVFVSETLVPGLVPIGGDRSGDRWCFDTRRRIGGTIPVLLCPHDGGAATYVAPSFAGFVYRLVMEGLVLGHVFAYSGTDREGVRVLTAQNLSRIEPWLLRRWVRRAKATLAGTWPTYESFDDWMRQDRAFAAVPTEKVHHFR